MKDNIHIYGIKNCDTMKKAFKWLDDNHIAYVFHDFKKDGFERDVIERAIQLHGWETVINRRGTTWRKLSDAQKDAMDAHKAVDLAEEMPSIVKRPVLVNNADIQVGFSADRYAQALRG